MPGKDKKTLSKNAQQSVKKKTDEFIEDDDLDIDAEVNDSISFDQTRKVLKQVSDFAPDFRRLP